MIWQNYQLGNIISKASEAMTLWQTEKGIIEIGKNTLAIPIKLRDKERGYVFHGNGKLLLDTIVETEEGAIGKPVEKELNDPFLMLGNVEEIQKHFTKADEEDFAKMGYENQQGFVDSAEELFNQFFKKEGMHGHQTLSGDRGVHFRFSESNQQIGHSCR